MPDLFTTATVMMCPHGGNVTAISANLRANAGGSPILRVSDTFIVAGCSLSGTTPPTPCLMVQWTSASRVRAMGDTALNQSSVGLCVGGPGGPVQIVSTQAKVSGQ